MQKDKVNLEEIEFKNEKRFLSNMFECKIFMDEKYQEEFPMFVFDNQIYSSSEHLYQSLKSNNIFYKEFIRKLNKPTDTKKYGGSIYKETETLFDEKTDLFFLREDWDKVKISAMELCLKLKFTQNEELKQKLLNTKNEYIEERNSWYDTFWGTCKGKGENHLGKLLMSLRSELRGDLIDITDSKKINYKHLYFKYYNIIEQSDLKDKDKLLNLSTKNVDYSNINYSNISFLEGILHSNNLIEI